MTFIKTPEEITQMLVNITTQLEIFFLIVHGLFLAVLLIGFFYKKVRNILFFSFIAFLSIAGLVISTIFVVLPNIIMFGIISILIINAFRKKELNFELLIFGFWYLHWVEDPIWINALFYSPIGGVNCPTMLTILAFLCFTIEPRSNILEVAVGVITLYFGFFGIFLLGAYIDIILIVCGLFLLMRAYLIHKKSN
jgi:hypothetical protein